MNNNNEHLPKLYRDLADWWHILSVPEDYAEEAAFYEKILTSSCSFNPNTLLELGSGGGNNASHLKKRFKMTLVDLAPGMLEVSRALNPECEHIQGDMRSIRLECQFDAIFIHDAVMYMVTEDDLRRAMKTAYIHCKPGGAALFAPDHVRENFKTHTDHGGHDRGGRSLRYLEWAMEPDSGNTSYLFIMVYLLRDGNGDIECVLDKHRLGLFSRDQWLQWLAEAGFKPSFVPFEHSEIPAGDCEVFIGRKPLSVDR
jgi:SAM-dependent methyltransferase